MRTTTTSSLLLLAACAHAAAPAPSPSPAPSNTTDGTAAAPVMLAVVLVIDRSGSMQGAKLTSAQQAVESVRAALPPDAELGLVAFDTSADVLFDLTLASDRAAIDRGAARLVVGGGTDYRVGLTVAEQLLEESHATRQLVLFVSDGEAAYDGVVPAVKQMTTHAATVSAVGLGPDADQNLLAMIAEAGAGRLYMIVDPADLARALVKDVGVFLR